MAEEIHAEPFDDGTTQRCTTEFVTLFCRFFNYMEVQNGSVLIIMIIIFFLETSHPFFFLSLSTSMGIHLFIYIYILGGRGWFHLILGLVSLSLFLMRIPTVAFS